MAEWYEAPDVEALAKQLIEKYHRHLRPARIKYLYREGKWSSNKRTTWAKAYKVSERDNFLHGYDFLIVVNREVWFTLDQKAREALIDHELSHCGISDNGWCIWGHDLEDFAAVVRRHGAWSEDVRRYLEAAERREQDDGPRLFDGYDERELRVIEGGAQA
jgi:hypothetical protein